MIVISDVQSRYPAPEVMHVVSGKMVLTCLSVKRDESSH